MADHQPEQVIDIPGVGTVAFPASMSEQEMNAAATKLYKEANPGKKQPPVTSWVDTAVDWLPTAGIVAGTAIGSTAANPLTAVGGGAFGGMVGDALKQGINKLRGADVPETVSGALGEMAGETAKGAAAGATSAAIQIATPIVGAGMRVTGQGMQRGADLLRAALESGDPVSKVAKFAIPKLRYAPMAAKLGGKALEVVGRTAEKVGESGRARDMIQARLARMPLAGRLAEIGRQKVGSESASVTVAGLENVADDVALVRESIGMKMAPETALKIVADGDGEYYELLKAALLKSVKDQGVPPPKAVSDLLKTATFQKLSQAGK